MYKQTRKQQDIYKIMYVQIWPDDRNSHSHYEYKKKLEGLNM